MDINLPYKHRLIKVSEQMHLRLFEGEFLTDTIHQFPFNNPKAYIGFNFCVAGGTGFALSGGFPTAYADASRVNIFVMPACEVTQELSFTPRLQLVTLYIDLAGFIRIMGDSLEVLPIRMLDSVHTQSNCYFESFRWQPIVHSILSQIFHATPSPLAKRIFIESKSLELVAMVLDIYQRGNEQQFRISRSDIDKIHYVRELLLRDIAQPPSLSQLARLAGTNEFTLKRGFKELFNKPVFKYLQEVRLAKAYELFQSTNLQVNEVCDIVGYESISSFNRAFRAFYGLNPSEVKRIPFRTI